MVKVQMVKATKETNLFNAGQKLWVVGRAGTCDLQVCGRHRSKNRYITGWIHDGQYSPPVEFEVEDEFAKRHRLMT